jgi:peptide/nickel transport system substrate-binding protein
LTDDYSVGFTVLTADNVLNGHIELFGREAAARLYQLGVSKMKLNVNTAALPSLSANTHARVRVGRTIALIAVIASAALVVAGCSAKASTPTASAVLNVAITGQPKSLNPADASNGITFATDLAYQSLIDVGAKGQLVPAIATSWKYTDSTNEKFVVELRKDVKFSDGSKLDATDVAKSITYFKTGTSATVGAFTGITAKATGKYEVTITSASPNPIIPTLLTPNYLGGDIISAAGLAKPSELLASTSGAGPYKLDPSSTVSGDHYTFIPNKYYYNQSAIHYKKVVLKVFASSPAILSAINTGQVDVASGDVSTVASVNASKANVLVSPLYWVGLFILDRNGTIAPALKDVRVRQAMNYAIDRKAIAKAVYGKYAVPTDQPNTAGWDAYDASLESKYPYDPAKAKQLLAAAGYPHGFTVPANYLAEPSDVEKVVQAATSQLAAVGITLQLKSDTADYGTDLYSLKFPVTSLAFGGQSQFANTSQNYLAKGSLNPFNAVDPALKKAFDAMASAPASQAKAQAQAVEKVIVDQALSLPIVAVTAPFYVSKSVSGVTLVSGGAGISNIRSWVPAK